MLFIDILPLLGFLVLIFLLAGKILFMYKKSVRINSGKELNRARKIFLYPVFIVFLGLFILQLFQSAFHFSSILLPSIFSTHLLCFKFLSVLGAATIILSLILFSLTLKHIKNSLRFGLDENNQGELITDGIFSISRNPFFLSFDLYFLGNALIFFNLFFIGFAVLALFGIHFFILKEEKFLRKYYGAEYEKYSKKVGRYFTFRSNNRKTDED